MTTSTRPERALRPDVGFKEFVALIATMMAINGLAVDIMLPALPDIGAALKVATENQRQWIITAYLLGFGASQVFYGPISDRFGRKPVVLFGMAVYTTFSLMAAFATSFEGLIIARVLQGVGSGAARVLATAIVRDRFAGRQMARVMSAALMAFLIVPIVAPSIGQAIVLVAPWRWTFGVLTMLGTTLAIWVTIRLPETLHPEDARPISPSAIWSAVKLTLTQRTAAGYMLASTAVVGGLFGYVTSAQQVFTDAFHEARRFPILFASVALALGAGAMVNARIVGRFGMRVVSHGALFGYLLCAGIHTLVAWIGNDTVVTFTALQAATMFFFGMIGPNFGSLAMEPLGHVAGTASSVQGLVSTTGGALLGFIIAQNFDGTSLPLALGFFVVGAAALIIVLVTERGRLMRPSQKSA